jgi:YD repeat-containing protein
VPEFSWCVNFTPSVSTNQIITSGYAYVAAGNLMNDGNKTYTWDAEGHLIKVVNGAGTAISTNTYNALGQRAED